MPTFLFDDIVFGPIKSRRLGNSLGVNLLPKDAKVCNFNCVYCECGWTDSKGRKLPTEEEVLSRLNSGIKKCLDNKVEVDVITFAGNGEPTMHPQFDKIIDHTINLRDQFFPDAKIAVLSNAGYLGRANVVESLLRIDMPILKLDSAMLCTIHKVNQPVSGFDFNKYLENIVNFPGRKIIQTMFLKYTSSDGSLIDNTTQKEVSAWLEVLKQIKPDLVMIYSVARDTPDAGVSAHDKEMLNNIAGKVRQLGFSVDVS